MKMLLYSIETGKWRVISFKFTLPSPDIELRIIMPPNSQAKPKSMRPNINNVNKELVHLYTCNIWKKLHITNIYWSINHRPLLTFCMQMPFLLPVVKSIGICVGKLITSILSWPRLQIYTRAQKSFRVSKEKRKNKKNNWKISYTLCNWDIFILACLKGLNS